MRKRHWIVTKFGEKSISFEIFKRKCEIFYPFLEHRIGILEITRKEVRSYAEVIYPLFIRLSERHFIKGG